MNPSNLVPLILMGIGVSVIGGILLGLNYPLGGQNTANVIRTNNTRTVIAPANLSRNQISQDPGTTIAPANQPTPPATGSNQATQENNAPVNGLW